MRRSQPWSIMCALNETQTPQHQHNEAWFISVSHLVRFSGFHTPRRTSKKYYQSWIGSLHLRLSPLSYTLFRFLFIRRSSLNNLRTKKKTPASRIMTKAIFFRVLCIKNIRKQRSTRTHTHSQLIPITVFLPAQFASSSRWNFMHLVFDLRRIDGLEVFGTLLLSHGRYLWKKCQNPRRHETEPILDLDENLFAQNLALAIITGRKRKMHAVDSW